MRNVSHRCGDQSAPLRVGIEVRPSARQRRQCPTYKLQPSRLFHDRKLKCVAGDVRSSDDNDVMCNQKPVS
jgi:hypothetical protein